MSEYQRRIVYLSESQKDELFENGSVTVDGVTINYSDSDVYVTPQVDGVADVQVGGTSVVDSHGVANIPDAPVQSVNGQTGAVVLDAIDVGAGTYSKPSGGIPASDLAAGVIPTVPVQDVQVNGTSVVTDGVANIPFANGSKPGVIKVDGMGFTMFQGQQLIISKASDNEIKAGTQNYYPIVPGQQHKSIFYGLAKAAGDTTQSQSSNPVGTYTDSAKSAIQTMLGVEQGVSFVETVSGTVVTITGIANTRYVCGEVATITITPPSTGTIDILFESGSTAAVLTVPSTVKWPEWFDPTALDADTTYELVITDSVYGGVMAWPD